MKNKDEEKTETIKRVWVELLAPHTHASTDHQPGDKIELTTRQATTLIAAKRAKSTAAPKTPDE